MSTLPPCSRGGMVRQASVAARSKSAPLSWPRSASLGSGGRGSARTWGVAGVEVHGADVFGVVGVADLVVGPVLALDPVGGARTNGVGRRDVRMPAVVAGHGLLSHRHAQVAVDLKDDLGHGNSSSGATAVWRTV